MLTIDEASAEASAGQEEAFYQRRRPRLLPPRPAPLVRRKEAAQETPTNGSSGAAARRKSQQRAGPIAAETAAAPRWSLLSQQLPPLNLNENCLHQLLLEQQQREAEPEVDGAAADAAPPPRSASKMRQPTELRLSVDCERRSSPRQQAAGNREQQQQAEEGATTDAKPGGVITEQPQPVGDATAPPPLPTPPRLSTSRRFDAAGIADEGLIVRLRVHRTDQLKNDTHIRHPRVRVHVVDTQAGRYLAKQHPIGKSHCGRAKVRSTAIRSAAAARCASPNRRSEVPYLFPLVPVLSALGYPLSSRTLYVTVEEFFSNQQ
uniref:Uncharacterized protein n=1 Tax=Macrostomum lignano TaxID=282301 RepID=A0A1I8F783_9PLAT